MTEDFEIEGDSENALWCGLMWRNAWKNFRERSNDLNIIIVNCDYLRWKNSKNKVLKAYLRQQLAVDFSNKKHEVLDDIRKRMGVPKALASVFSATSSNYNNCNNWFTSLKVKFIIVNWKIPSLNANSRRHSIHLYVTTWGFMYVMYSSTCTGRWRIHVLHTHVYSNIYRLKDCSLHVISSRYMTNLNISKNWKKWKKLLVKLI